MLGPSSDDLEALANAVREAGRPEDQHPQNQHPQNHGFDGASHSGRRGHLFVLPPLEDAETESS
jgi:hypothetical protein